MTGGNESRSEVNVVCISQLGPDSGLDIRFKVLETFQVVPASLGSGSDGGGVGLRWREKRATLQTALKEARIRS